MQRKEVRYIFYSQLVFYICFLICILIRPGAIRSDAPLSYYGNLKATILPYAVGLLVPAILIFKASRILPKDNGSNEFLQRAMTLIAACLLGVLATPYTVNIFLHTLHFIFSHSLIVVELITAAWISNRLRDTITYLLFIIQLTGVVMAILSIQELHRILHLFAIGQLIAVGAFGILITRSIAKLEKISIREAI